MGPQPGDGARRAPGAGRPARDTELPCGRHPARPDPDVVRERAARQGVWGGVQHSHTAGGCSDLGVGECFVFIHQTFILLSRANVVMEVVL